MKLLFSSCALSSTVQWLTTGNMFCVFGLPVSTKSMYLCECVCVCAFECLFTLYVYLACSFVLFIPSVLELYVCCTLFLQVRTQMFIHICLCFISLIDSKIFCYIHFYQLFIGSCSGNNTASIFISPSLLIVARMDEVVRSIR